MDLHTWPGNTKAVPLYKKCELVEEFFKTLDWYKDSIREIQIKPGRRIKNKFDLWNYTWKKDNKNLKILRVSIKGEDNKKIKYKFSRKLWFVL